jgi:LacI family gluconate utilization system Gnt-I transcriptional repressor
MKSRSPTMFDVARRAGVSSMTVSRAFKNPGSVSDATRRKVERAAVEIDFVPDRAAGALRSGYSNIVAAIVPSLNNSKFNEILQGLSDELTRHGLVLSIGDNGFSQSQEYRVTSELASLKLRGLVLVATSHNRQMAQLIDQAKYPVIEVGDLVKRQKSLAVGFSNRDASRVVTEHLLARGCRRILFATFPLKLSERARSRLAGYQDALEAAGVKFDPNLVVEGPVTAVSGASILGNSIDRRIKIDAFFGTGGILGIGASLEARRRGIDVPRELAIANFDDHDVCEIADPPLTCLRIPRYEIGSRAAKLIVETRMPVLSARRESVDLGFSLVVRGSTSSSA